MEYIPQILFLLIFSISSYFIYKSIVRIRFNILLGRDEDLTDHPSQRLKKMFFYALGQKKMFKKPIPAFLHLFVYVGFIIVNIEIIEILLDGFSGSHRILLPLLSKFYPYFINVFEFFAVTVIASCLIFLIRRNILKLNRFKGQEIKKWPKLDANIILTVEILLMLAFLSMNAADASLQSRNFSHYNQTGTFYFSSFLVPIFQSFSVEKLFVVERFCWWFHIIGVLCFANYIFIDSKHLHIFMSFPNTFYSRLTPVGKWSNMANVTKEVKLMLNIVSDETQKDESNIGKFGAKDVVDLSWKNILDAYSCTECGRCTQQCPANITGKKLSPRKIMMDTRDRAEELGKSVREKGLDFDDGKALLDHYITAEELLACTTCNACIEACPVNINPLSIITQLKQYRIMEESKAPSSWNNMSSNIENNFAPWKFSPSDRYNWSDKLNEK